MAHFLIKIYLDRDICGSEYSFSSRYLLIKIFFLMKICVDQDACHSPACVDRRSAEMAAALLRPDLAPAVRSLCSYVLSLGMLERQARAGGDLASSPWRGVCGVEKV